MSLVIEKGDDLFELIFELDRRLQAAQNYSSPLINLTEAYKYLDSVLIAAKDKQPDIVDTVFLKLVDFFIKCNCNYKRSQLSSYLSESTWLSTVKSRSEALRRLCQLWDNSFIGDFETCSQILNFMSSCTILFFDQSAAFGLFYESFINLDTVGGSVFGPGTIFTCSLYIQKLFDSLNENLRGDEKKLVELILISKFASSSLSVALNDKIIKEYKDKILQNELYRILIICNIIDDNFDNSSLLNQKEIFSNLLIYF
jgi:hypothetical protein